MKYVLMFCNTPELGDKVDAKDSEANYQEIFAWFDEHYSAGRIVDGGAELQPATTATTVKSNGDQPVVVDGPFIESKEVPAVTTAGHSDCAPASSRSVSPIWLPPWSCTKNTASRAADTTVAAAPVGRRSTDGDPREAASGQQVRAMNAAPAVSVCSGDEPCSGCGKAATRMVATPPTASSIRPTG